MTMRTPPPRPGDGALVRLGIVGEAWAERIPPVPRGVGITVSFSDEEDAHVHGEALGLLGYRVVGTHGHGLAVGPVADFLVPQRIIDAHPRWWRALADQAQRAFNLAAGPVAASLGGVLDVHARPLQGTPR